MKQCIIINEKAIPSIIKDVVTYGGMGILFFLNNKYLGDSWVIDVFVLFLLISSFISGDSSVQKFNNKKEAISYINKL
jgi:hypothetical protein